MSRRRTVLLRIAGSVVGLLVVGIAVGVALFSCLHWALSPSPSDSLGHGFLGLLGGMGGVVLGTLGAAAGATVTQKVLKQRSSFPRALLGAFVGLVVGALCGLLVFFASSVIQRDSGNVAALVFAFVAAHIILLAPIVAGAVIGSGRGARPAADAYG